MKKSGAILMLVLAAAFVYGLTQLFKLRFEAGDIYPAYSSLRTDPLGAKALYDSFDRLFHTERNFRPMPKLESGRDTAFFVLAIEPKQLRVPPVELQDIERY